ncbi:zinc metallopeptidase [Puniceicoccales bacterium CK1056]|uniref:Zinc metallopeptidase n=1 Tax=Oceanipulchritudo coccoides TaxID=2706888 RepID=A0A6B2LXY0_9BACT|nr:zinc metallopeptidase [Oceanipulchritudo coccoides]NDV60896.1 zinc metallopeptidase [Oceanipulchritudo coccoides]
MSSMQLFLFLIIPTAILGMFAQAKVQGAYKKWSRVGSRSRITGREAAAYVMQKAGVTDVEITSTRGHLTDHYDPTHKRLVLSEENYRGSSLAALGVAAHEAGHAIQHATGYSMLKFRMSLVPITMFASKLLPFVIIGGFFFGMLGLIKLGVLVYLVLTVFQLVTLPVEFDASRRAKVELVATGILQNDEMVGVNKTLDAAALTYVAAFVSSLANLLYLFALSRD